MLTLHDIGPCGYICAYNNIPCALGSGKSQVSAKLCTCVTSIHLVELLSLLNNLHNLYSNVTLFCLFLSSLSALFLFYSFSPSLPLFSLSSHCHFTLPCFPSTCLYIYYISIQYSQSRTSTWIMYNAFRTLSKVSKCAVQ